ncbi:MAG: SGNH/GDSL hydrolase family protein [Chitinispirillaceae bacterium]
MLVLKAIQLTYLMFCFVYSSESGGEIRKVSVLIALLISVATAGDTAFITPADSLVRYTGRFDTRKPDAPRFDWPGNSVELRFGGTSCAVRIKGDGGYYNITVDDSSFVLRFDALERDYQLASGLEDTVHYLRISKRFENRDRLCILKGFVIDSGRTLHPLDPPPARRIEFIGGSNAIGFGVESRKIHCDDPNAFSNADLSFAAVAARILNAQHHIVGISGKGLVRNWRTPFLTAQRPFGNYYMRTLRNKPSPRWDFSKWIPQVVVVSFGTNDFSTPPHPRKSVFFAHYRNFLMEIEARYPGVQIVCVTSSREPLKTYVKELVKKERRSGRTNLRFFSFGRFPSHKCGCDWHPNREVQREIGEELAEVINPLFGE